MRAVTRQDAKELIIKTLDVRGCATDQELLLMPELCIGIGLSCSIHTLLDELVDAYEIISVEFAKDDDPSTVRAVYFPLGTCVYEPGLRVKGKILPTFTAKGIKALKDRNIVNDDMLVGVSNDELIKFYDAIHTHVQQHKYLNADEAKRILNKIRFL
jgi:hypothetical protein